MRKIVSTRKKNHQNKKQLSLLDETLNAFIVGNNTNAGAIDRETLDPLTSGLVNDFELSTIGGNSASQDHVVETNIADQIKNVVENIFMAIEKRVHDAILTAMDNLLIPRVEILLRSVIESQGRGPNSKVQNTDKGDFSRDTENTPLMSASSLLDLHIDQDRNYETLNVENFEDGNFPASRSSHDRQMHAHQNHIKTKHPREYQ